MAIGAVELLILARERMINERHLTVAALEASLVPVTVLVRQILGHTANYRLNAFKRRMFQIAAVRKVQCHTGLTHHFYFSHSGALALRTERQSARMPKIKKCGLDQYGKV